MAMAIMSQAPEFQSSELQSRQSSGFHPEGDEDKLPIYV